MSVLDRVGLAPKSGRRPKRPGLRLEGRAPAVPLVAMTGREIGERGALIGLLVLLTVAAFPRVSFYENTAEVGDVWQGGDVVAPFNFPIRISDAELAARRDSIRREESPIFAERAGAPVETRTRLDSLAGQLGETLAAYAAWQGGAERGGRSAADSLRFFRLRESYSVEFTERQWGHLLGSYAARAGFLPSPTRESGAPLHERLFALADESARIALQRDVLDVPMDSVPAAQLVVRNLDPRVRDERAVFKKDALGADEVQALARRRFHEGLNGRADSVRMGMALFTAAFQPNLVYQREASARRLAARMEELIPTRGLVKEGQTVVRRGDQVTEVVYAQLASLEWAQRERSGEMSAARTLLGQTLLALAAYAVFFLYLFLLRRSIFDDLKQLLLVALLFGAVIAAFAVAVRVDALGELAVPVALVSILLTVVFDSRVGILGTVTLALVGGLVFGFDFAFAFATLFAGVLGVFSVRDLRNRSQLFRSAALVLVAYLVVLGGYALLRADPLDGRLAGELIAVGVNVVLLLLVGPILWAFEKGFGVTTDLALLELSDTNRPLLKELSLRAPGTFNHVLQVANLAEAAADAIGANGLRTRVGALYHDIGKMLKPEYYIENQPAGENPHDRISPHMSALIIASHVKDGLELGREYKLSPVVLEFIPTHHGTSLMEFFFRKAVENRGPNDPPVDEAEFRYPGPRPATNEQGIVMLADSVEAASRSLQKPTPKRLEALIESIFRARIEDGQLGATNLTFADLTRIKETFLSLLCGIYHFRVRYPGQDLAAGDDVPSAPAALTGVPDTPPAVEGDLAFDPAQRAAGSAQPSGDGAPAEIEDSRGEAPAPEIDERATLD